MESTGPGCSSASLMRPRVPESQSPQVPSMTWPNKRARPGLGQRSTLGCLVPMGHCSLLRRQPWHCCGLGIAAQSTAHAHRTRALAVEIERVSKDTSGSRLCRSGVARWMRPLRRCPQSSPRVVGLRGELHASLSSTVACKACERPYLLPLPSEKLQEFARAGKHGPARGSSCKTGASQFQFRER